MPQDGYRSVTVSEEQHEQAADYKPDGVTWGEVLVAGAERLNDSLDSDPPAGVEVPVTPTLDTEAVSELKDQLSMANEPGVEIDTERLLSAVETIEERTGKIERMVEDLQR